MFAYGFEDLTGAEWRLIEALAARGEVHVSLPYEPARAAFASLSRTSRRPRRARRRATSSSSPPAPRRYLPPGLAHLERHLFDDGAAPVPLDGSIRFLEGAGRRATLELVAETVLELVRGGTAPEEIAIVCPSLERSRASIETAFGSLGVPIAIEARPRLATTAFGQALLSLLRFAWSNGTRRELFSFLRTPYGGLGRADVDFLEGRLRGRAVLRGDRTVEETTKLRTGRPLPMLELLAAEEEPLAAAGRSCWRCSATPTASARRPPRRGEARSPRRRRCDGILDELERLREAGVAIQADDVLSALDRATVRGDAAGEPGRVAVLDLDARADAEVRGGLRDRARAGIAAAARSDVAVLRRRDAPGSRRRPRRPAAAARRGEPRPLPLLHRLHAAADAAHARARGGDRRRLAARGEPVLGGGLRALRRRRRAPPHDAAAARAADLADRVGSDRARAAARARAARGRAIPARPTRSPTRTAGSASSGARGARSRARRRSGIRAPWRCSASRETFRVTDLERMAGCSSAWFVERYLRPGGHRPGDRPADARLDRARRAAALLQGAAVGDPGCRARDAGQRRGRGRAHAPLRRRARSTRACGSTPTTCSAASSGRGCSATSSSSCGPRRRRARRSCRASSRSRSRATSSRPGVAVGGKIDRVDVDPLSARGIVVDYKSGAAPSATQIHDEARLQIPLYLLVLRDQLGLEPMGGVYMPLGGGRRARGMLRAGDEQVPGFAAGDYLDGPEFEAEIEHARAAAVVLAERIRAGDVAARPARRRLPGLVRPLADVPQGAAVSRSGRAGRLRSRLGDGRGVARPSPTRHATQPPAAGRDRAPAARRSSRRAPAPARRPSSSSGSPASVIDDGLDVDSLLVITYTDRAAGRAAGADQGPPARARAARPGTRPRRRLDLDDPRLLPPASDRVPARRRHRSPLPRARRVAGARAAGRGLQRRPGGVLRRRRARPLAAPRHLQGRRPPQDARQRLRHAALGRAQADPRARRP